MRQPFGRAVAAVGLIVMAGSAFAFAASPPAQSRGDRQAIEQAVAAPTRTAANVVRDKYRHPVETLSFVGVRPKQTVVEIWPAGGWYTEILAPLTRGKGTYYAAGPERQVAGPTGMMQANPQLYDHIRIARFPAAAGSRRCPMARRTWC